MTVIQLSARSVKVQLSADELQYIIQENTQSDDSQQMLHLLVFMLSHAEAASSIPFSELPVTVELFSGSDGGLIAYFTAALPESGKQKSHLSKTVRLTAQFTDFNNLSSCCRLLIQEQPHIISSSLYEYSAQWYLSLKLNRSQSSRAHHLLLEFGKPYRSSVLNKARLSEYGRCIFEADAVSSIVQSAETPHRSD